MYVSAPDRLDRHPANALTATRDAVVPAKPRHDLYGSIHKALRAFLADTLVRVGRIDVDDDADKNEALDQLGDALDFVKAHIRHEDDFVHPAIESRQLAGAGHATLEHEAHEGAMVRLRNDGAALRSAQGHEAAVMAQRLYLDLCVLVAETLAHLHHEETVLSPLLWRLFDDDELAEIHGRLRASISPPEMASVLRWVMPASTPSERAALVLELQGALPPEVVASVLAGVRMHVDQAGWLKLVRATGVKVSLVEPVSLDREQPTR